MGPRVGNKSPEAGGKDSKTIATASQGHNVGKHEGVRGFKNPDAINVGNK